MCVCVCAEQVEGKRRKNEREKGHKEKASQGEGEKANLKGLKIGCVRVAPACTHQDRLDFRMLVQYGLQTRADRTRHGPQLKIVSVAHFEKCVLKSWE